MVMAKRIVFHGSDHILRTPLFGKGDPYSDYGVGFYTTFEKEKAALWASKYPSGGVINSYSVEEKGLRILDLSSVEEKEIMRWVSLLLLHRFTAAQLEELGEVVDDIKQRYPVDLSSYDIVIGYRADDNYFNYAWSFMRNEISFEKMSKAMRIGSLGRQYVLLSELAFTRISFLAYERLPHSDSYQTFRKATEEEYHRLISESSYKETFLRDIMKGAKI